MSGDTRLSGQEGNGPLFFEGAEKKFEMITRNDTESLRQGTISWDRVVSLADAQILSAIHNRYCDAYLLSESSLFVFDHRVVMITCGQTSLVSAALHLVEHVGIDPIDAFIYERKNEQQPDAQKTSFQQDTETLDAVMSGRSLFFGDRDGCNVSLYYLKKEYKPKSSDTTLELLMHRLPRHQERIFSPQVGWSADELGKRTGLAEIIPGFSVDSFLFDPLGYSLNAVKGGAYFTVHVTPQSPWSYASFETNFPLGDALQPTIERILRIFSPENSLVLFFQPDEGPINSVPGEPLAAETAYRLSCGYRVAYCEIERSGVVQD